MSGVGISPGKTRDAQRTREAILAAAEEVFSEHGFAGARIDVIAEASGYNKSLIGQYFGDKLGLYAEVVKRVDMEADELLARVFSPFVEDEASTSHPHHFQVLVRLAVQSIFDYLLEHPRMMRILLWEMADGWQTARQLISQFKTEGIDLFGPLFHRARKAGLLRSDFNPALQFLMILQTCQAYLASIPLHQMLFPHENLSASPALARARDYLVTMLVHGMVAVPEENDPQAPCSGMD